ncbi:MAG: sugar phosphate isomerase/epimerase [Rhodothermales bacterium]
MLTDSVSFDLERAVHYALLWGLEGVELRRVGGMHDRVPHVNEQKVRARLVASELPVVAVDPGTFMGSIDDRVTWMNEIAQFEETLGFCRRVGCERIVVSSFRSDDEATGSDAPSDRRRVVDALQQIGRKAQHAGIRLCVLNERDGTVSTGAALADLLEAVDMDVVGAAWDPAAARAAGEDVDDGLAALGGRVAHVRCRNVSSARNGWAPAPIDEGEVDWPAQVRLLAGSGYGGPLSLEVDVEPLAKEGLRGAMTVIRLLRAAQREPDPSAE